MASTATRSDFVSLVAQEIAFGIDHALDYWLGRIEMGTGGCQTDNHRTHH